MLMVRFSVEFQLAHFPDSALTRELLADTQRLAITVRGFQRLHVASDVVEVFLAAVVLPDVSLDECNIPSEKPQGAIHSKIKSHTLKS